MSTATLYEEVWKHDEYRKVAPGQEWAYKFIEIAKPEGSIIDFGSGTGKGASLIYALTGNNVLCLDFASNSLDDNLKTIKGISFKQHDLREPVEEKLADYGYCTDVMEHIAPEEVDKVLVNILKAARKVFFAISTTLDHFGPVLVGEPLHLTVETFDWWKDKFEKEFCCRILWSKDEGHTALFYVTAFANGKDFIDHSVLNVTHEKIKENIRANLELGLQEVSPHIEQDTRIILLAGGPSLNDFKDQIVAEAKSGVPIVTVNGSYNWALNHGIEPAAQILVDARDHNRRFVEPVIPRCRYLIGSQADPEVVKSLPKEQVWLWHSKEGLAKEVLGDKEYWEVFGGSTVTLRALPLLAMLGFRKIEIYGWDGCLREGEHHAYSQPENDEARLINVRVGGREFVCHPWMVIQAHETQYILRALMQIDNFKLCVHGDGIIAHILATAAAAAERRH